MKLFVYGTLKRGHGNNQFLQAYKAKFLSEDTIPGKLYTDGGLPYVEKGTEGVVIGEIWEVDAPTMARLDRLEGHPMWYQRTEVTTGKGVKCEVYYFNFPDRPASSMRHITSGIWEGSRAYRA